MESLSIYGLIEHFNVQIRESKSHPKIPRVYMNYEVIFIKGSRDPSYPLIIEVRWTPNLSLFQFEFIPHLDIFLFEMQNVIAACSTILFNNLIPIKTHISTIIRALVMFRKETCKQKPGMPIFFFQYNRPIKQHQCAKCLLNLCFLFYQHNYQLFPGFISEYQIIIN